MNYKESKKILEEIKKAKRILVNCHRQPDPDSIGSALSCYQVIKKMGKKVSVISPSDLSKNLNFLPFIETIKIIDYDKFDFSPFDLFICLDSSSWKMVTGLEGSKKPDIAIIVIDHHKTNERYGKINLVDDRVKSTGELLYMVFEDWGANINESIATTLLTGIIGDTGAFQYPGVNAKTFDIAKSLMVKGADKDKIINKIFRSNELNLVKFWGEVLRNMELDSEDRFVWSAIPYETFERFGKPESARESSASLFSEVVEGTDFGMIMIEQQKNKLSVSLRSRTGFDTSKISVPLGGGGHVYASGAKVEGLSFEKAVEKVLQTARKFAKKGS